MKIKTKYDRIQRRLLKARDDLLTLQAECTHEGAEKTYRGDTGNWCRADDSYWIEFRCPHCSKFWTEEQ